jgi:hypothetical protein
MIDVPASPSTGSTDGRRLVAEQVSQLLPIVATLLERVLLTAIFYRYWGENSFASWSVLVSLAGLMGLAEFGFAMYFSNGVALAVQRQDDQQAVRMFRNGFTILSLAAMIGWIMVVGGSYIYISSGSDALPLTDAQSLFIVAAIAMATALKLPMAVVYALYRAHLRFAWFTMANSGADIARILATASAIIVLSAGPLAAAMIALLATAILQFGWFVYHTRRHYPTFELLARWPSRSERKAISKISFAYFAQTLSNNLLTVLPVLLIERQAASATIVATFVLMRTLMGLPRMLLQTAGVVVGYETSRHLARGDPRQAMVVIRASARSIAVASGLITGGLLAVGPRLTEFWVDKGSAFDASYAAAAAIPLVFSAASILSHNILITANIAYLAALGRITQFFLTMLLFIALPIADIGLRMFIAVGLAEVSGYATLSYIALHRRVPEADFGFHIRIVMLSLIACTASWVVIMLFSDLVVTRFKWGWMAQMIFAAVFCGLTFLYAGLSRQQRRMLFSRPLRRA